MVINWHPFLISDQDLAQKQIDEVLGDNDESRFNSQREDDHADSSDSIRTSLTPTEERKSKSSHSISKVKEDFNSNTNSNFLNPMFGPAVTRREMPISLRISNKMEQMSRMSILSVDPGRYFNLAKAREKNYEGIYKPRRSGDHSKVATAVFGEASSSG